MDDSRPSTFIEKHPRNKKSGWISQFKMPLKHPRNVVQKRNNIFGRNLYDKHKYAPETLKTLLMMFSWKTLTNDKLFILL